MPEASRTHLSPEKGGVLRTHNRHAIVRALLVLAVAVMPAAYFVSSVRSSPRLENQQLVAASLQRHVTHRSVTMATIPAPPHTPLAVVPQPVVRALTPRIHPVVTAPRAAHVAPVPSVAAHPVLRHVPPPRLLAAPVRPAAHHTPAAKPPPHPTPRPTPVHPHPTPPPVRHAPAPATTTTLAVTPTTTSPPTTVTSTTLSTTTSEATTTVPATTVPVTAPPRRPPLKKRVVPPCLPASHVCRGIATYYSYVPGRCATSYRPLGSYIRVSLASNLRRFIVCRVTDRQGYNLQDRIPRVVDLSQTQWQQLSGLPLWRGAVNVVVNW